MTKNIEEKFNPIMPECDERIACFQIEKPISPEGYEHNLLPRLDTMMTKYGEIRLLIYYKNFQGWEPEATYQDMEATLLYGKTLRKLALVNAPEKEIFQKKMKQPLLKGEIRFFSESDLQKAIDWVKH